MSIFVEACKEHVKNKGKVMENETVKKCQNSFSLHDAIKKEKAAYEKDRTEESKKKEDKLLVFLGKPEYFNFLQSLLDYCRELFRLENKQQVLQQEAKQRDLAEP